MGRAGRAINAGTTWQAGRRLAGVVVRAARAGVSRSGPTPVWGNPGETLPIPGPRPEPGDGDRPRVFWPAFPPEGYLGQLTNEFQRSMAAERAGLTREDCRFYHSVEVGGEAISGPWDLRGRESAYLGQLELAGRRVLELGPSTGHLSFWMEEQGAEVVCFDAGFDASIDLLPAPGGETRKLRHDHARMVCEFQNSWWYLHRHRRSTVRMVYGDIYRLPGDLGEFDVSTFQSILLHLRSPIAALEEASRRTRSTIVVTDTWPEGRDTLMSNTMRFFPVGEAGRWVVWWEISAGAVVAMLQCLGFGRTTVTTHTQLHQHGHRPDIPYVEQPMYTVVGERT